MCPSLRDRGDDASSSGRRGYQFAEGNVSFLPDIVGEQSRPYKSHYRMVVLRLTSHHYNGEEVLNCRQVKSGMGRLPRALCSF